ncbi:MAG: acyl-phosphate glycerol 3-phosphate acyltransferase [Actinobacteria bacterium RBG_16_64_13]|nr:MAG: acyl-phosphate glycerol 3-phosphate acyltransferase [Actinobacteria bacterium RBG_16_64_13]
MSTGSWLLAVALVVFGYLMGSISPSVFLGKIFKGLDVRKQGSGNAGTTNAFRVLGIRLGLAVLIADFLKGVIPVVLARYLSAPLVTVIVAFACVTGHNYSIFLRGRGGKGVATGAGAAVGMMPLPMAFLIAIFAILVFTTRIVAIASITCTILLPVMAVVFHQPLPYIVVCCLMSIVVLWAHRANMLRLWERRERRVVFPWNKRIQTPVETGPAAAIEADGGVGDPRPADPGAAGS